MWFAKWFGGATEVEEEDEPARHSPPPMIPKPSAPQSTHTAVQSPLRTKHAPRKGFDPYNSGAFERRNAWERINRR